MQAEISQAEFVSPSMMKDAGYKGDIGGPGTVDLQQLCYISVGMVVNAHEKKAPGEFKMADLLYARRTPVHSRRFVQGKQLSKWAVGNHDWIEWGTRRAPALFRRQTFPEMWGVREKLLAVRTPGRNLGQMRVALDDRMMCHNESVVAFVPWHALTGVSNRSIRKRARYGSKAGDTGTPREKLEEFSEGFDIRYVLGIMNSSSAQAFLSANRRSNLHVYPDDWKRLPVPVVDRNGQRPVVEVVETILRRTSTAGSAGIPDLEGAA